MRPIVIDKAKVIELHEKCNLSQAEISRLLGCTQGYVNAVLRNSGIKRRERLKLLMLFCPAQLNT